MSMTGINPLLEVLDVGCEAYAVTYARQLAALASVRAGATETILLVEHPAVYTSGRKEPEAVLEMLRRSGVPVVPVERGGRVTYHNPGQLVAYPILRLEDRERDLHRYLRTLEATLIATLADFGIAGEARGGETGVWVVGAKRKVASIGVAVRGWVTFHGVALNVCNDLAGFMRVSPCGYSGEVMTSMQRELCKPVSLDAVQARFLAQFAWHFGRELTPAPSQPARTENPADSRDEMVPALVENCSPN